MGKLKKPSVETGEENSLCQFCLKPFKYLTQHQNQRPFCRDLKRALDERLDLQSVGLTRNLSTQKPSNSSSSDVIKSGFFPISRNIFFEPPAQLADKNDDSISAEDREDEHSDETSSGGHETSDEDAEARDCGLDFTREKAIMDFEDYVNDDIQLFIENIGIGLYDHTINSPPESLLYLRKQNIFYQKTFGIDSLKCETFEDFVASLREKSINECDALNIKQQNVFQWLKRNKIGRDNSNELLRLINSLEPKYKIPIDVRTLEASECNDIKHFEIAEIEIDWLKTWKMDRMIKNNFPKIKLYIKDPIEIISYLLIDPQIMLGWKKEVHFRHYKLSHLDSNKVPARAYGNVMTSNWCELSEREILAKDPDGNILPIILYADGVSVSDSHVNNKITPVICTIGNFSDELQNQTFAKSVLSYLPNYNSHSKVLLVQHLVATLGISISAAERNVKYFELFVERVFWSTVVKIISNYAVRGVKLHVLGQGIKTFYPRIAFICGDDPSQHRICGLSEGMAAHGCTYCNYKTLTGLVYDPERDTPRDIAAINRQCILAEPIMKKVMEGIKINKEEKIILKQLKVQNVHPYVNPFHSAPMGSRNNIFKGAPPDLLHLFCAGLMKSLVQFTMTIVSCMSKLPQGEFKLGPAIFDYRISNFPYVHEMPHLYWTRFSGGLMQFGKKSKKEREMATGSLGGFKSTTYISLLMQIYFAIGWNNDVLPGTGHLDYYGIDLGNAASKVLSAISSLLDAYFQSKRTTWTNEQIDHFGKTLNELYVHFLLVWDLKQTLLGAYKLFKGKKPTIAPPRMRKLHMILHLVMYIVNFGSLNHMDTSTYESLHKYVTTGIWETTSQRHITLIKEMTSSITAYYHQRIMNIKNNMLCSGMEYVHKLMPNAFPDGVLFTRLSNITHYEFFVSATLNILLFPHPSHNKSKKRIEWKSVCKHSALNDSVKFLNILKEHNFKRLLLESYGIPWIHRLQNHKFKFIHGLSYKGSEECQVGNGTIYAIPKYNKYDTNKDSVKPRHDFILINNGENSHPTLACILLMFELENRDNNKIEMLFEEPKFFLIVQHLIECKDPRQDMQRKIGKHYQWAGNPINDKRFLYDIITAQMILRPVMVIPSLTRLNKTAKNKLHPDKLISLQYNPLEPSTQDRFFFIDRHFFDRSGWEKVIVNDNVLERETRNIQQTMYYLNDNQTGFNNLIPDDDDSTENTPRHVEEEGDYDDDDSIIDEEDELEDEFDEIEME